MHRVCLIVPAYRHYDYVISTVRSAFEHTPDVTVVVVDDGTPQAEVPPATIWNEFDRDRFTFIRFSENGGLTRSWNSGLALARIIDAEYAVCGNSDLLVSPGWFEPLAEALNANWALAGPVTNAPGTTIGCKQAVWAFLPDYEPSDDPVQIAAVARQLQELEFTSPIESPLNGFCLAAKTAVWWSYAFNELEVFDPQYKMTLNEDRLQGRWRRAGLKFCVCPKSYVLHYRSVSRGDKFKQGKWLRKS